MNTERKTSKVVLSNDFHNTEVTLRGPLNRSRITVLSDGQIKKAYKALCGMDDCQCKTVTGVELDGRHGELDFARVGCYVFEKL